jgi:hypothetical protein
MIVTLIRSKQFGFEGEEGCTRGRMSIENKVKSKEKNKVNSSVFF